VGWGQRAADDGKGGLTGQDSVRNHTLHFSSGIPHRRPPPAAWGSAIDLGIRSRLPRYIQTVDILR
jgi:hypothetical protein